MEYSADVIRVLERADADEAFRSLLWSEPSNAVAQMDLSSRDLAIVLGIIRHGVLGRERGARLLALDHHVEAGDPTSSTPDELVELAALTDDLDRQLREAGGSGVRARPAGWLTSYIAWAERCRDRASDLTSSGRDLERLGTAMISFDSLAQTCRSLSHATPRDE